MNILVCFSVLLACAVARGHSINIIQDVPSYKIKDVSNNSLEVSQNPFDIIFKGLEDPKPKDLFEELFDDVVNDDDLTQDTTTMDTTTLDITTLQPIEPSSSSSSVATSSSSSSSPTTTPKPSTAVPVTTTAQVSTTKKNAGVRMALTPFLVFATLLGIIFCNFQERIDDSNIFIY